MAGLFTLRVFARNLLIAEEFFFSYFCFDAFSWNANTGFASTKPTQYVLDNDDIIRHNTFSKDAPPKIA